MSVTGDSSPLSLNAVIYATDFSPCSENAGGFASLLAKQFSADLLVSHAFVLSQAAMEAEASSSPSTSTQRKDLEIALAAVSQRFGAGIKRSVPILLEGDPRKQIPALAQQNAPSIIVLGTEGRGRIERGFVGSVSERILRSTSGPSLAIGPNVPTFNPSHAPFRRILYATGLSPTAAQGATYATAFAEAFHSSMDILHIVNAEDRESDDHFSETRKKFNTFIEGILPKHANDICNPKVIVDVGSAHERILHHARESSADLLVLTIRKSSHLWLQSRLSGAFQIIANAPCPVMTIVG